MICLMMLSSPGKSRCHTDWEGRCLAGAAAGGMHGHAKESQFAPYAGAAHQQPIIHRQRVEPNLCMPMRQKVAHADPVLDLINEARIAVVTFMAAHILAEPKPCNRDIECGADRVVVAPPKPALLSCGSDSGIAPVIELAKLAFLRSAQCCAQWLGLGPQRAAFGEQRASFVALSLDGTAAWNRA